MTHRRVSIRFAIGIGLSLLVSVALSACGGGGVAGLLAGGGIGGTGLSTGAILAFGSVEVNGVHYLTDDNVAAGFVTKKMINGMDNSSGRDRDVFRVGMVVTVRHSPDDNNATEIDYEDNIEGPIGGKNPADNTIVVLGQAVVVDNAALFALLNDNNVVEVSGFADNAGRIRATFIEVKHSMPRQGDEFEIKGFISGLPTADNTFKLGPLPDGSGATVTVGYTATAVRDLPGGPANGMYVEVKTSDTRTVGGRITASKVEKKNARTDFPEGAKVDFEGLVTKVTSRSGKSVVFELEGKEIHTSSSTGYPSGGDESRIQSNVRLQAGGTVTGGILSADKILFR